MSTCVKLMNQVMNRSNDAALECCATLLTWLPTSMPQELQGGVPKMELDCLYPLAVVITVI